MKSLACVWPEATSSSRGFEPIFGCAAVADALALSLEPIVDHADRSVHFLIHKSQFNQIQAKSLACQSEKASVGIFSFRAQVVFDFVGELSHQNAPRGVPGLPHERWGGIFWSRNETIVFWSLMHSSISVTPLIEAFSPPRIRRWAWFTSTIPLCGSQFAYFQLSWTLNQARGWSKRHDEATTKKSIHLHWGWWERGMAIASSPCL